MKFLRKFNESFDFEKIEDYIFSFIERDMQVIEKNDNYIYINEYRVNEKECKLFENFISTSPRFKEFKCIIDINDSGIFLMIIEKSFYNKNIKVEDIKWEPHIISKEASIIGLEKNPFTNAKRAILPKESNCSLVSGLFNHGQMEFWAIGEMDGPDYVFSNVELQHYLYKYII